MSDEELKKLQVQAAAHEEFAKIAMQLQDLEKLAYEVQLSQERLLEELNATANNTDHLDNVIAEAKKQVCRGV